VRYTDEPTDLSEMQARAYADAYASLGRLRVPEVLPALHAAGLSISRTVLGGSHSVAVYPPIDSLTPVGANRVLDTIRFGRDTSLYVHIPFCETRCTFCHYTVQHYPGRGGAPETRKSEVARYLEALKRELAFWGFRLAQSDTALSSIYIGGGTPLVLEKEELHDIIREITNSYEILPGAEVCIEGSPHHHGARRRGQAALPQGAGLHAPELRRAVLRRHSAQALRARLPT
jgi:oxygen-independent coproporphyrinogen III oxidase